MALRGDWYFEADDISLVLNDVAEAGVVLCYDTQGSGSVLGDTAGECQLAADPSGLKPYGVLLQEFVNVDTTLYHLNFHKNEHDIGSPAQVLRRGWVVTDKVTGTPAKGDVAYLTTNGVVTPTMSTTGGVVATPIVGEFGGAKDEAGYVKLIVNLPTPNARVNQ